MENLVSEFWRRLLWTFHVEFKCLRDSSTTPILFLSKRQFFASNFFLISLRWLSGHFTSLKAKKCFRFHRLLCRLLQIPQNITHFSAAAIKLLIVFFNIFLSMMIWFSKISIKTVRHAHTHKVQTIGYTSLEKQEIY